MIMAKWHFCTLYGLCYPVIFLGIWSGWKKCDRVWRLLSRSVCKWSVRAQTPQSQNVIFLLNVDNIFCPFRRVADLSMELFCGLVSPAPSSPPNLPPPHTYCSCMGMMLIWLVRTLGVTQLMWRFPPPPLKNPSYPSPAFVVAGTLNGQFCSGAQVSLIHNTWPWMLSKTTLL